MDGGGKLTSQYENDIVIIKEQNVFPQSVKSTQQISLVTYVQNLAERNPDKFAVSVNLYDTCGVFKEIKLERCSTSAPGATGTECKDMKLLPKEVKEVSWTLIPDPAKVKVPIASCKLKVAVSYPYKTSSQTEIYFINSKEAQLQKEQGTFKEKTSVAEKGEGPVVAYILPDSNVRQPILGATTDAFFPISLYIENKGSGFLSKNSATGKSIMGTDLELDIKKAGLDIDSKNCAWETAEFKSNEISLIGKKSPPIPCSIKIPQDGTGAGKIERELTKRIEVNFKEPYYYEFRKETIVTIEPS